MDLSFVSKPYKLNSPGLLTQLLNVPLVKWRQIQPNKLINSYLLKLETWEIFFF